MTFHIHRKYVLHLWRRPSRANFKQRMPLIVQQNRRWIAYQYNTWYNSYIHIDCINKISILQFLGIVSLVDEEGRRNDLDIALMMKEEGVQGVLGTSSLVDEGWDVCALSLVFSMHASSTAKSSPNPSWCSAHLNGVAPEWIGAWTLRSQDLSKALPDSLQVFREYGFAVKNSNRRLFHIFYSQIFLSLKSWLWYSLSFFKL